MPNPIKIRYLAELLKPIGDVFEQQYHQPPLSLSLIRHSSFFADFEG